MSVIFCFFVSPTATQKSKKMPATSKLPLKPTKKNELKEKNISLQKIELTINP